MKINTTDRVDNALTPADAAKRFNVLLYRTNDEVRT